MALVCIRSTPQIDCVGAEARQRAIWLGNLSGRDLIGVLTVAFGLPGGRAGRQEA